MRNYKRFRKVWGVTASSIVGGSNGQQSGATVCGVGTRPTAHVPSSTVQTTWHAVKPFSQRESELSDDDDDDDDDDGDDLS